MEALMVKKAELDLLRSMFALDSELKFEDALKVQQLDTYAELGILPDDLSIDFVIKVPKKAEFSVTLPPGYPGSSLQPIKPTILLRIAAEVVTLGIDERQLMSQFTNWLEQLNSAGDPTILSAVQWLEDRLRLELSSKTGAPTASTTVEENNEIQPTVQTSQIVCLWIVSHHIRSPIKRRLILQWAEELRLGGCCMPGKPGLIVLEGDADNADECWRRLRSLQWKRIQLRDREVLGAAKFKVRRFADGFHEVVLTDKSRFAWLAAHGVLSEQFELIFGIPGRLATTSKVV